MPKIESGNQRIRGGAELSLFGRVDHLGWAQLGGSSSPVPHPPWTQQCCLLAGAMHGPSQALWSSLLPDSVRVGTCPV